MAVENKVLFKYGLQEAYSSLNSTDNNTLYIITDTQRIYKGNDLIAANNIDFLSSMPSGAEELQEGKLYVVTENGKTSIVTKSESEIVTVGGGKATEVENGAIKFESLSSDIVASNISEEASESKVPTEKAVKDYVDSVKTTLETELEGVLLDKVVVGVSVGDPTSPEQNTSKIGLHFTTKKKGTDGKTYEDDDEIVIDLDKEKFLSSAKLEDGEAGKKLVLTLTDDTTVEIDLAEIVANAQTVKTVDEIEVQLGDNASLGGYKTGDKISTATPIETIIKKLLAKQVPPTYTQPTIELKNDSGTASGNIEFGTSVTPKLTATFTQKDAGTLTQIVFNKNGQPTQTTSESSPAQYTEDAFELTTETKYTATATYAEGATKKDNLGEDYPTGKIQGGSKTSSEYKFTPYRPTFYGTLESKDGEINSTLVRSLSGKTTSASSNGTKITVNVPAKAIRIVVAYPKTLRDVNDITSAEQFNSSIKDSFTKQEIQVNDASGKNPIDYKVYVKDMASGQENATTYTVTI